MKEYDTNKADMWGDHYDYFDLQAAKAIGFFTGIIACGITYGLYEAYIWLVL